MYRCEICGRVTPSRKPLLRNVIKRDDGSIAKEQKVCADCHEGLQHDLPLAVLQRGYKHLPKGKKRRETAQANRPRAQAKGVIRRK